MKNILLTILGGMLMVFGVSECLWLEIYTVIFLAIGAYLFVNCFEAAEKEFSNYAKK